MSNWKSENPFEKKPVDTSFPSGKPVETSSFSGTISDVILKSSGKFKNSHGLGWFVTGLFVVGDLAGGGIVALPTALIQTEFYPGIIIMLIMTLVVTFTSYVLGRSWTMLISRWPEYREHTRKPYAEIGYRANGARMKHIVSVIISITQFMIAVVYILLSSRNIQDIIKSIFKTNVSYCLVIICLAICLLPLTFLKSPNDFWWAVVIAMFTTSAAVVLIIVGAYIDHDVCHKNHHLPPFRPTNYFLALGTFLFAYGGHTAFPTIQHDMRCPADFTKSTFVAFSIMTVMYLPTALIGVAAYGDSLRDSVIPSIQTIGLQQAINVLITVHLILTLTIVFNPVNQEVEDFFRVPHRGRAYSSVFGLLGGGAATYSAFRDLTSTHFEQPCYISAFKKGTAKDSSAHTNCCGVFQNVTRIINGTCTKPDVNYYTS